MSSAYWQIKRREEQFECGNNLRSRIKCFEEAWEKRCYTDGLPDEVPRKLAASGRVPSYKALALAILNNDHNLHSVGFATKETIQSSTLYKANTQDGSDKMRDVLKWLNDALATKDIGTHYRIAEGAISATNGQLVASHPWTFGSDEFLVPGVEFEKVLKRMSGEPSLSLKGDALKIKSGKFQGTVQTLPLTEWKHLGIDDAEFKPIPKDFLSLTTALQPFVGDKDSPAWGQCVAISKGWLLATNDKVIAGAACAGLEKVSVLLPSWAVDFILGRTEGLKDWAVTDHYIAFRWSSGAWMRSQLIVGQFPEKAAQMVRDSAKAKTTQKIDDVFREAILRVGELAEDTVSLYAKRIEARFGKCVVEDGILCEVPKGAECSVFGARFLLPALKAADSWSPSTWPEPSPWKGKLISGYVVGRRT